LRGGKTDVGAKRRLAHARAAGNDQQVGLVKAADLRVEAFEAGRQARQVAPAVQRTLGGLERVASRFREALGLAVRAAFLGDLVQLAFRLLDLLERRNLLAGVDRAFDHVAPDPDQCTEKRQVVDLLCEVLGRDQGRPGPGQARQIPCAADLLHRLVRLEHRAQSDRVRDHVLVGQLQDRIVDPAVELLVEMVRLELEPDVLDETVVEHERAKERGLGFDISGEGRSSGGLRRFSDSYNFCHDLGLRPTGGLPMRT